MGVRNASGLPFADRLSFLPNGRMANATTTLPHPRTPPSGRGASQSSESILASILTLSQTAYRFFPMGEWRTPPQRYPSPNPSKQPTPCAQSRMLSGLRHAIMPSRALCGTFICPIPRFHRAWARHATIRKMSHKGLDRR